MECNPLESTRELIVDHNTSPSIICRHLKKIGKDNLCKNDKEDYISKATRLLSRLLNDPFLKNIITGNENWDFYDNIQDK